VLVAAALAAPLDEVSAGDIAWFAGDRRVARDAWRSASEGDDPAAAAMAHLRLLWVSGNLGAVVHGPAYDRSVRQAEGPWALLAEADFHLFAPAAVGADPRQAVLLATHARAALDGPAAARLWLATGDPAYLLALRSAEDLDGLGRVLVEHDGRLPPTPSTWYLGLGVSGAPGLGVGAALTFTHPDLALAGWYTTTSLAATSRGSVAGSAWLRSPGATHVRVGAGGSRLVGDLYLEGEPYRYELYSAWLRAAPGVRRGHVTGWLGAQARVDSACLDCDGVAGHGPWAGAAWDTRSGSRGERRGVLLAASGDAGLVDYPHVGVVLDARQFVGLGAGALALRATWAGELADGAPFFVLPTAGGATLHRGASAARYREASLTTVDVEQRWPIGAVLEAVVFGNAVWAEDALHPGAGGGLRIVLPPEAYNVVRVDVAVSDSGWGVYAGWGEAF